MRSGRKQFVDVDVKARFWFVLSGIVAVIAIATVLSVPREPVYQGKRLSHWAGDLMDWPYWKDLQGIETPKRRQAVAAIRAIGTNAVSLALDYCRREDTPLRTKIINRVNRVRLVHSWNIDLLTDEQYHRMGINVFRVLGPDGEPAVPELIRMFEGEKTSGIASLCLRFIGADAVPALAEALTNSNPQVRRCSIMTLGNLGASARDALPPLLRCLEDADFDVRSTAPVGIVLVGGDPAVAVPALLRSLKDPRFGDRSRVVMALGRLRGEPEEVLPALFEFLNEQPPGYDPTIVFTAIGEFGTNARPVVPALTAMVETNRFKSAFELQILGTLRRIDPERGDGIFQQSQFARTNAAVSLPAAGR